MTVFAFLVAFILVLGTLFKFALINPWLTARRDHEQPYSRTGQTKVSDPWGGAVKVIENFERKHEQPAPPPPRTVGLVAKNKRQPRFIKGSMHSLSTSVDPDVRVMSCRFFVNGEEKK